MRFIKRAQAKLAQLGKTVSKKVVVGGAAVTVAAGNAMAAITAPTPDYTSFDEVAGVGLAVTLIVGLAYKAKGFLS